MLTTRHPFSKHRLPVREKDGKKEIKKENDVVISGTLNVVRYFRDYLCAEVLYVFFSPWSDVLSVYLDPRHVDYTRQYKYRKGRNRRICMLRIMNIYPRAACLHFPSKHRRRPRISLSFLQFCLFTFRQGTALTFYFIYTLSLICATLSSTDESFHHLSRCTRDVSLRTSPGI